MSNWDLNLLFRKSNPGFHSIERVFESMIPELDSQISVNTIKIPKSGGGPITILSNLYWANRFKNKLNHVTGDAHYLILGLGKRSILTIHDVSSAFSHNILKNLYVKILWFWLPAIKVKKITVISEFTKLELQKLIPFAKHKIEVIPNPVDRTFHYQPKKFNEECPHILLIGTKENKNLERSISALENIVCQVTIIGSLHPNQLALLRKKNITFNNRYNISDSDMYNAYVTCDVVCFPSTYEGFGMPIIEAQAIGRPVLTSNILPMKSVAGKHSCLVDPFSINAIRDGLERIINQTNYRNELIEAGLINVERFSQQSIVSQYMNIYKSVMTN